MKNRRYYMSMIDAIEGLTDGQITDLQASFEELIDDAEDGFKEVADKLSSIRNVYDLENVSEALEIATNYAKDLY